MNGVSKISVSEDVALVTFHKVAADLRFISAVLTEIAQAGINIDMISQTCPVSGQVSVSFTAASDDLVRVLELTRRYKEQYPEMTPLVSSGNSKVQLFGQEMRQMEGVAARAIATVSAAGGQVLMITTSEVDISLLLSGYSVDDALARLEEVFAVPAEHS